VNFIEQVPNQVSKRLLFCKKRSKKLLSVETGGETAARQVDKSFLVLFFKKEHIA
jgi:hypothetical protein